MSEVQTERSSLSAHRSSLVLVALLPLILFLIPLLKSEVFTLRDHFDYFQPLRFFTAEELRAGRLPLWNPYNASGEPWLANPQTGVFYPPSWLFLLLPFATAYMLFLCVHLVVLGCGAYLLFARRASAGAALVGATALMFSGPMLSLLDVSNNLATLAWIPLALWCALEGRWRSGGAALALAFLGGEPFFAAVGALLYAVAAPKDWRLVRAALVAFGLSAVQLLPFLQLVQSSDRAAGLDAALILHHSMPWRDWPRIAIPTDSLALGQQFLPVIYTGVIVCVLAALGIGRKTWPWLVLLALAVFLSTGPELIARLPLTLFRYPARLVALAALAIAALAVAGWDRIRPHRRWLDVLVALAIVVDLVPRAWPLLQTGEFRRDVVPYPKAVGADTKMMRVGVIDPDRRAAWISGYLNLYDRRFDAFTAAPVATDAYMRMYRRLQEKPSREELARKAIGWIITPLDLRFPPAASARGVHVYRNELTLPMAVLLVRSPLRAIPARVSFDTSHARVTVDAPREGVVVVYQQNAPGWRATIDGVEAPSHVVDRVFRVVQVTRGHHEIVWSYRPRALFAGAGITAITLLAVTLFSFVKRSR
jgi:hypothetical protein